MKKSDVLKKRKWLKDRRKKNTRKKQHNYESKTHRGVSPFYLTQNLERQAVADAEDKKVRGEMAKVMGLNPKEVF